MGTPLRVLIIEDSDDDAALLMRELERGGYEPLVGRAESVEALEAALDRQEWDLICADYTLPGFRGTTALAIVRERGMDVPFIFVSGTMGEDVAVQVMKAGADDYFVKGNLRRLAPAVSRELLDARVRRERARLEGELLQAQRLESVGRLAGGLAHDLNNLLTVIAGHVDLLEMDASLAEHHRADLHEIERAAARAAALTRQLLAFSRQQVLDIRVLDVNSVVEETERMLTRLLGEKIRLETRLAPDLAAVEADPGQLQQVIVNLVLNARDAMPGGGELRIETANQAPPPTEHGTGERHASVLIHVVDTGTGMDAATREKIFEPFFTTKGPGEGTGLGLPTAYGIITQIGGQIHVESSPGKGSTFTISLPVSGTGDASRPSDPGSRRRGRPTL